MSKSGPIPTYKEPKGAIRNGDILIAKENYYTVDTSVDTLGQWGQPVSSYKEIKLLTKGKKYTNIIVQKSKVTAGEDIHFIHDNGKMNYWVMYKAMEIFDVITVQEQRKEKLIHINDISNKAK